MEHTQVLHSGRLPARISSRRAAIASPSSAPRKSRHASASGGPGMKKQGCTWPFAPITVAERFGALQRTAGNGSRPHRAEKSCKMRLSFRGLSAMKPDLKSSACPCPWSVPALEHRQVLGAQRQVGAEVIEAPKRVGITTSTARNETWRAPAARPDRRTPALLVVRPLQGHSNARSDPVTRRRADPFQDLVECIETPDRRVRLAIRPVQRHRNEVEQRAGATCMLRQRQSGREQPELEASGFQQLRDLSPLRMQERFTPRQRHRSRTEQLETGQQASYRRKTRIGASVPPMVTGDAARITALRHVERHQGQAATRQMNTTG